MCHSSKRNYNEGWVILVRQEVARMRCTIILSMVLLSLCLAVPVSAEDVAGETGGKSLDQMSKEEILASPRWKRAEEAMEDWLSLQLYTPQEIDQIEEKLEVASGNSSTGIQDVTRTQVYRKTPSIVNSPRERQKQ